MNLLRANIAILFSLSFFSALCYAEKKKSCVQVTSGVGHQLQVRTSRTPSLEILEGEELEALRSEIAIGAFNAQNEMMLMAWKANERGFLIENSDTPYLEIFSKKIKKGWDINEVDEFGRTALMHASATRYGSMTRALLKLGARVDLVDKDGRTAADISVALQGSIGGYKKTTRGIPTDIWYIEKYLSLDGVYIADMVKSAFEAQDFKALESLFKRGVYVDTFDLAVGKSLLTRAIEMGDFKMARFLLSHGANPKFSNRNIEGGNHYPMQAAVMSLNKEAVELLLAHGADINAKGSNAFDINSIRQVLWYTSYGRSYQQGLDMFEWLLEKGADTDANINSENVRHMRTFSDFIKEILGHARDNEELGQKISAVLKKHGYL